MATITVLVEGRAGKESWSTVTLVRDAGEVIVVDPGTCNQDELRDALAREGLAPSDVTTVCLTHPHLDHTRNLCLFPDAAVLDYWGVWRGQELKAHSEEWNFTPSVRVLRTPGHCDESITLLVTTPDGQVAICGDVFWHADGPDEDPYANKPAVLRATRARLKKAADTIIPGHGGAFTSQ